MAGVRPSIGYERDTGADERVDASREKAATGEQEAATTGQEIPVQALLYTYLSEAFDMILSYILDLVC